MTHTSIDKSVQRVEVDGFQFPLGVYPVEASHPKPGYTVDFEPADGGDADSDWEEWPDRYMYDVVAPANRLRTLCRTLFSLLPTRVYPILDIMGEDAYREVDPYIAYDPVGYDRFIELLHRRQDWLYEDGLVGFGAMSDEPFLYVYVDEHKIVTVRVQSDLKESVERVLGAFGLTPMDTLCGADAAAHEHRSVLDASPGQLLEEEILEELIDGWRLQLNVEREGNFDDEGRELGVTGWRCLVRLGQDASGPMVYGQVWLRAGSAEEAELEAVDAVADAAKIDLESDQATALVIIADRLTPELFGRSLADMNTPLDDESAQAPGVLKVQLLDDDPDRAGQT